MRAFIIGLFVAIAFVFMLPTVRTIRHAPIEFNFPVASFAEVPAAPRAPRMPTVVRTVKRGTTDYSCKELKIEGQPRENRDRAFEDALKRGIEAIEDHFGLATSLEPEDIKPLVRDPVEKNVPLGENLGDAKRVEFTLQLDDDFVEKLAHLERESRVTQRMQILARSLAVVVAGLFAIAGYVRLDEWSKGYYSGLLKAVAVLAVIGIGLAAFLR